jgi:hypothetical protein
MHAGACAYNQDTSYRCTVSVRFWCIESNHARDSPDHVSVRELPFSLSLFSVPLYMTHTHTTYICTFLASARSFVVRFADQDYIAETKLYYDTVLGKLRRAGDLFMPGRWVHI